MNCRHARRRLAAAVFDSGFGLEPACKDIQPACGAGLTYVF
ncbi:MAG TPA: hypothetical protein VMH79_12500 [Thermoanaerobaculia bacterium]|nr:hypothetical protein [Thermoanaerobaculia bacterium]